MNVQRYPLTYSLSFNDSVGNMMRGFGTWFVMSDDDCNRICIGNMSQRVQNLLDIMSLCIPKSTILTLESILLNRKYKYIL